MTLSVSSNPFDSKFEGGPIDASLRGRGGRINPFDDDPTPSTPGLNPFASRSDLDEEEEEEPDETALLDESLIEVR